MALIALSEIVTRDKDGTEVIYQKGDEIKGIDKKEASRLIELGEAYESAPQKNSKEISDTSTIDKKK